MIGRRAVAMLAVLLGCPCMSARAADATVELIADGAFAHGVKGRDRQGVERTIWVGDATNPPVWDIAQHGSRSCIAADAKPVGANGRFICRDDFAWLEAGRVGRDADAGDLILGLNAHREYDGRYRAPGDPWPHLYVSQRIAEPGGHLNRRSPSLAAMERLDWGMDVRLLLDRRNEVAGYDRHTHAAQFVFFLTVQNLARGRPGYGDYYWFGVCLYDDREKVTATHAMRDAGSPRKKGTEKLIYDVGVRPFADRVVGAGGWVQLRGDLRSHIGAGLREAWKRGYLADSTNEADYAIGSVVMGWEIPGLNEAAMAVRNLRATAVVRQAPPAVSR